jgi:hypothetical protein
MTNVEEIIIASLKELQKIGDEKKANSQQKSKLIFPSYCCGKHAGNKRVSEQEARLLFIEEFIRTESNDYYYSVETPTVRKYQFSEDKQNFSPKIVSEDENKGQSANVDVCVFDNQYKRKHLIEFKNGAATPHEIDKDFLKLLCDDENTADNYFIHIENVESFEKRNTLYNRIDKYNKGIENAKKYSKVSTVHIFLYNFSNDELVVCTTKGEEINKENCQIKKLSTLKNELL